MSFAAPASLQCVWELSLTAVPSDPNSPVTQIPGNRELLRLFAKLVFLLLAYLRLLLTLDTRGQQHLQYFWERLAALQGTTWFLF